MTNVIRIKKASFYAYHGIFNEEQNIGGKFEADVDIYTDFSEAATKDSLQKTIDYEKVYRLISEIAMHKKYYLIEALANQIANEIFINFNNAKRVCIKVRKNNPPIGGVVDSVEVEVDKTIDEFKMNNHK